MKDLQKKLKKHLKKAKEIINSLEEFVVNKNLLGNKTKKEKEFVVSKNLLRKTKKDDELESPIIIRHQRYYTNNGPFFDDELDPKGGVTYAFQIDYVERVARVGVAVCSENERFEKSVGREIAAKRLKHDSIKFDYDTPCLVPLVDAFWRHVDSNRRLLTLSQRALIQSIKKDRT